MPPLAHGFQPGPASARVSAGLGPQLHSPLGRHPATRAIVLSVAVAQLVRFGADLATFRSEDVGVQLYGCFRSTRFAWFSALILFRSREQRVLGTGVEEYRRVARASTALFGNRGCCLLLTQARSRWGTWRSRSSAWPVEPAAQPWGRGGNGSRRKGSRASIFQRSSWLVCTTQRLLPWLKNSRRHELRAIELLGSCPRLGHRQRRTFSMSTAIRFRFLVMIQTAAIHDRSHSRQPRCRR